MDPVDSSHASPAAEIHPPMEASSPPNVSGVAAANVPIPFRLPIVRVIQAKTGKTRLLAIYDDHIVLGQCRRGYSISEPMLSIAGEAELIAQLRRVQRLTLADICSFSFHPGPLFCYFNLASRSGKHLRFTLPKQQAGHVAEFLRAELAKKIPCHQLKTSRTTGALVTALGVAVGLGALNLFASNERVGAGLVCITALATTAVGLWLLFRRGAQLTESAFPAAGALHPARHAVLVAKPPLRSKPLGWTLKLIGLAYWFVLYSPLTDPLHDWLSTMMDAQAQSYIWTFLWFPAPLLIFTGYRLCQRRYVPRQSGDPRKPILFLRPFQDDEHTSLQPSGLTAKATGIRSRSALIKNGQTDIVDTLWSAHPMRVLRMVADYGSGSSEESIARYFERHGPVIAIGKPGEHLASPGAARMYLDDATWQQAILTEMERAQAVVMQPAPSEGVRWELTTIREKVAPNRVLLCLISYWNNPEYYEELSSVAAETLRVDLPRAIPYLGRPAFVYFDDDWNPHVQELSYKDPVLWPVTQDGADLKYSLAPFVAGMQGEGHQPARPARWVTGPKKWVASLAAIILGTVLIIVPHGVVAVAGQLIKTAAGGNSIFSGVVQNPAQSVARSPKIALDGIAVPYQIQIPQAMTSVKAGSAAVEYWKKTPDGHFQLQIATDKQPEDLSNLPQQRVQANQADGATVKLDSQKQFDRDGVHWIEDQITVTLKQGITVREIDRGATLSNGTVLITMLMIESPDSDAIYQKLADEIWQSFSIIDINNLVAK